ncbi:ATP-binding cassette domain-containing protein [Anaerotignum faecicola]|nr:ATP-binding cassette domain-containing protein [Anaerotignum faecicola]
MFSISFKDVSKIYENGAAGLIDANIDIATGEFVFLLGQSGSGKSTFLSLLTREILPTKGTIFVGGNDLIKMKRKKLPYLRRKFGIIREENLLLNDRNVYKNIELALLATQQPAGLMEQTIFKALGLVGMRDKAEAMPHELSGGERSKVELARAFVNNPSVIIADEPTSGLDRDAAWDIAQLFDEINRLGVTVIMATHDKEIVNIMQKRVVTLYGGRIIGDVKKGKYGYLI